MKKILRAIKNSWDFLLEPVIFRNSFWYMACLLFCDLMAHLIWEALIYFYG